jgi:DNA-damage-inducible protein J
MASTDVIRTRIDGQIKVRASNILVRVGVSVSDVTRMLPTGSATDKLSPYDVNGIMLTERKKS